MDGRGTSDREPHVTIWVPGVRYNVRERLGPTEVSHRRNGRGQDGRRCLFRGDTSEERKGLSTEGPPMLVAELAGNVARQSAGSRVVAQGQSSRFLEDQPRSEAMQLTDDPPVVTIVGFEIGRERQGTTYERKIIERTRAGHGRRPRVAIAGGV